MNPPIQSMPADSYQQSSTPMYPLKPMEVPTIPNSYTDGHGGAAVYPSAPGYPAQPPGTCSDTFVQQKFLTGHNHCRIRIQILICFTITLSA